MMNDLFQARVLVTNQTKVLPYVDKIYVLHSGRIMEYGRYETLRACSAGHLAFLLKELQNEDVLHGDAVDGNGLDGM